MKTKIKPGQSFLLVAPGAVPLHLTPGVPDPDQLDGPASVVHLKPGLKRASFTVRWFGPSSRTQLTCSRPVME